jgi:hypothetical protein
VTLEVRNTRPEDFPAIAALCGRVYPESPSWTEVQLASHLRVFPEGQFVALEDGRVVAMAASLIVLWDDYSMDSPWRNFTNHGLFTNHDRGVGSCIYAARRELVERLGLLRIRAGARLRGYHAHADRLAPEEYLEQVARGALHDPTLSFQLRNGFRVLGLIRGYLRHDPESLGFAACIEWLNEQVARPEDREWGDLRYRVEFRPPERRSGPALG